MLGIQGNNNTVTMFVTEVHIHCYSKQFTNNGEELCGTWFCSDDTLRNCGLN